MIHSKKILIHERPMRSIRADAKIWGSRGLESGGHLVGRIHLPNLIFEVTDFIDAGPKALRTPISFSSDVEYATIKKSQIQAANPSKRLLGEYHLHPWNGAPSPSGGDFQQLMKVKHGRRSWYIIMLATKDGFAFWDLDENATSFVEVPHQEMRLPEQTELSREVLIDRVLKVTQDQALSKKTALIIGLGSGGSVIAKYLSLTGLGKIVVVDNDKIELVNVIRHEGTVEDIGKPKTTICKEIIESHNPLTIVETNDIDVLKERKVLTELVTKSDILIASSGNAKVNNLINAIAFEKKIPVIFGGIFAEARGGYILPVVPDYTPCFNCLFDLTSKSYYVDRDAANAYNISEDELHAQQGLWIDISIPALMAAKVALMILQDQTEFLQNYNLLVYKNPFQIQRLKFDRRSDCVVCNFEGWSQRLQETLKKEETTARKAGRLSSFNVSKLFSRRTK
jgi:molybdopterin/thiamine biosynthesis adenylyltransferase